MVFPMFVMVMLTFVIGLIALKTRFASVTSGELRLKYYKLMEGTDVPEIVTQTSRSFNNQFEVPLLFYVACTLHISLGIESVVGLVFAWAFVLLRAVHACIHLTYNRVQHRMLAFLGAFLCAIILWLNLLIHQM